MGRRGFAPLDPKVLKARGSWRGPKKLKDAAKVRKSNSTGKSKKHSPDNPNLFLGTEAETQELIREIPGFDPYRLKKGYRFAQDKAAAAVNYWHNRLCHVKGELAGKPFHLERWEQAIIGNCFGWVHEKDSELRRFRRLFLAIARKNGKTALAAGFGIRLFEGDGEPGAEIVSVASTRDQARLVWDWARGMIRRSPELDGAIRIYQHSMVLHSDPLTCYKPVAAEAGTMHGANLHGAVIDEVHTLRNRELVDVIETSTGARRQPLIVMITTAGWDRNSICWEKWQYAAGVRDGDINDPEFLPVIFESKQEDDWTKESTWRKANPNLGVSIKLDYLKAECEKAKQNSSYENAFRQLHCNQWTEQAVRFFPMELWDKQPERRSLDELENQHCYGGLDLAEKRDLAGFTLVFPDDQGGFDVRAWAWLPEDTAREREKTDHVPYREWAQRGLVRLTPGDIIDFDCVKTDIVTLYDQYRILEIAFDRRFATQITTQLREENGIACVEIPQTFTHLSEPMKLSLELLKAGKLRHGNNKLLRWQASNTASINDRYNEGLVRPAKSKSNGRIDNITAMIMALSRAIVNGKSTSYYSSGGGAFRA